MKEEEIWGETRFYEVDENLPCCITIYIHMNSSVDFFQLVLPLKHQLLHLAGFENIQSLNFNLSLTIIYLRNEKKTNIKSDTTIPLCWQLNKKMHHLLYDSKSKAPFSWHFIHQGRN